MTDLAAILDAFADDSCPQAVLADWLEERGDERAERVRAARGSRDDLERCAVYMLRLRGKTDKDAAQRVLDSLVRNLILSWFPERPFAIHRGAPVTNDPITGLVRPAFPSDPIMGCASHSVPWDNSGVLTDVLIITPV